ncbi:hypothetical protein BVX93_00520 [bacterium B13(2017)]|nr:hypothetical protein BVX93_00520 [bacterium B13(2017)]
MKLPKEGSSYLDLVGASVGIFSDDGEMNESELDYLLDLALQDGEIDDEEKRVLKNIFSQVRKYPAQKRVIEKIRKIEKKYSI